MTVNKANKLLGLVHRTVGSSNPGAFSALYKSLVHPFLEYAAPAWNSYLAKTVLALEKVERRAFRLVKTWGDGTRRSFKEAKVVYTRKM